MSVTPEMIVAASNANVAIRALAQRIVDCPTGIDVTASSDVKALVQLVGVIQSRQPINAPKPYDWTALLATITRRADDVPPMTLEQYLQLGGTCNIPNNVGTIAKHVRYLPSEGTWVGYDEGGLEQCRHEELYHVLVGLAVYEATCLQTRQPDLEQKMRGALLTMGTTLLAAGK